MSLQVWLPLNGTTKSQGVKEIQISNHGATVDSTGGILGSCYSFTGTANQYLEFDRPMGAYYNDDFSWAIWVYPTTAKRGILLSEGGGASGTGSGEVAFELTATLQVRVYWNANPNILTTDTLPLNTWTHIAVTKTSTKISIYLNGELNYVHDRPDGFSERTSYKIARIGDDYRSGTTVDFAGRLNDLRIYDHALSAVEVREISRGLVCHYKMDDDSFGYYVDSSGYGNHMNITGTPTLTNSTVKYTNCTHFKNGDYLISPTKSNSGWLPTVRLTVNLWMKFTTWGNPISCTESGGFNFEQNTSNGLQFPNYINGVGYRVAVSHVPVSSLIGDWHMLTGTFDGTTVRIYIDGELKGSVDTGSSNGIKYANVPLVLSAEVNGTSVQNSSMVGELSDVRIYGTALSDEDIKQLCEVCAKIDKNGNLYGYEFVEENT